MPRQIAILHGWSDTSKSFEPLVTFLDENGFDPVPLWLGDYISLDDDVRVTDVAKRMQQVIQDQMSKDGLAAPFDMIVHSTGGLVARQWLGDYYPDGQNCPAKRLVMLAPANFGSKLAAMGQSMLGRVVKGWNNWFHTGKEMLKELELASPYQWDLAQHDLFGPEPLHPGSSPYGGNSVWPFVIVGTHPYASGLRQAINENGSDGTVRVAAANLNARGVTIDFASNEESPPVTPWTSAASCSPYPVRRRTPAAAVPMPCYARAPCWWNQRPTYWMCCTPCDGESRRRRRFCRARSHRWMIRRRTDLWSIA